MSATNPWTALQRDPPYVLASDREAIDRFNASASADVVIHTELLPEPYFGCPDAPVVLLGLNPGFSENDDTIDSMPQFVEACRSNLVHQLVEYPFLYLDPRIAETPGANWWRTTLLPLFDEGLEVEQLSDNILCVEWFPYHSTRARFSALQLRLS